MLLHDRFFSAPCVSFLSLKARSILLQLNKMKKVPKTEKRMYEEKQIDQKFQKQIERKKKEKEQSDPYHHRDGFNEEE